MPNGIEAASCKLDDPKEKKLRNKAPRKTTQWFILGGLSTSSRNWTKYPNAYKQIVKGIQPPRASLNLSRQLFRECECIHKSLLDKVVTATTERSTHASRSKEKAPMAFDSPPPQTTRPQPTIPTVTPAALFTVQEDTAVLKDTPFLDRFVGERDKDDKEKLTGVLKDTVDMLAPSKHDRSLKVMSANGKETLISMVPKSKTESGFIQLARKSNWLKDIFEHTR
jgi:hypothetical protein